RKIADMCPTTSCHSWSDARGEHHISSARLHEPPPNEEPYHPANGQEREVIDRRGRDLAHIIVLVQFAFVLLQFYFVFSIPTVSLDVISLVASNCEYYRGHIEQCAA